jgi:hypothetical protein
VRPWPYYSGAVFPEKVYEASIIAGFFLRVVAPSIAATTLLANIVLLSFSKARRFWKWVLILQVTSYLCVTYLISRPTPEEVEERQKNAVYEKIKDAYVSALKRRDFVAAEKIFTRALENRETDFPNDVACVAADNALAEGLAFSIRLEHKFAKQLPVMNGRICRAAAEAIANVEVEKALAAVESGEVITFDDVALIVKGRDWRKREYTGNIPIEQQLALFQIAVDHHFVAREDWSLLARIAVVEQQLSMLRKIVQSTGGPAGLTDHGAQAIIAAAEYGWPTIKTLLVLGVDIDEVGEDSHGLTATVLVAAVERAERSPELVAALLEHGAGARVAKGRAPLAVALDRCDLPIAKLLLGHGADPNAIDPFQEHYSETPFELALRCANANHANKSAQEFLQDLLRHGANFTRIHNPPPRYSGN